MFPNRGETRPEWRLGNLKTDDVAAIVDALENDRTPDLQATFRVPVSELAHRFGRPRGERVYVREDLKERWIRMWADGMLRAGSKY